MLKAERREAKQNKQKHGMRVVGRSVKTVLAQQNSGSTALAVKRRNSTAKKNDRRKRE